MSNETTIKEITLHLWRLYISHPDEKYPNSRRNCHPQVMADTAKDAIDIVQERYPGSVVWSIQHVTGPRKNAYEDNPVLVREEAK